MRAGLVFSLFLILRIAAATYADGDVVYSALYYEPGGLARNYHSHIYRMNPDGSGRTQLTFGEHDDEYPHWSPDGKWIAFARDLTYLCVMQADANQAQTIAKAPDFDDLSMYCWMPDSKHLLIIWDDKNPYILDVQSKKRTRLPIRIDTISLDPSGRTACVGFQKKYRMVRIPGFELIANLNEALEQFAWLSPNELIGTFGDPDDEERTIVAYSGTGRRLWMRKLTRNPNKDDNYFGAFQTFYPVPGNSGKVLVEQETSLDDNNYLLLDLATGRASRWSHLGGLFGFSPDGRTYLISTEDWPPVELGNGKLDGDGGGCSLLRGRWPTDTSVHTVTPGHVEVTGFDWRGTGNPFPIFNSVRVWP